MLGSKNDFFYQKENELLRGRLDMLQLLSLVNRSDKDKSRYYEAYIYFCSNPDKFDGATIVRDLFSIKRNNTKLDIDAMLHDYEYITGANLSFKDKFNSDLRYFNNMIKNGKGVQLFRLIALILSSIFFVPYCNLKKIINE